VAYDLVVAGVRDFARLDGAFAQQKIARDPLSGVVDGSNKIFFTGYAPIQSSGSVSVFVGANSLSGTCDTDTGQITTGSAPATQPVATYTYTPFTLSQQLSFLIGGVQAMENEWPRGLQLVDANSVAADEDSGAIYVLNSSGSDFLTNQYQIGFFMAACRYYYLMTMLTGAAITDYSWRETVRGMSVDKSKRPGNLSQAVDQAYQAMKRAMERIQDKTLTGNLGAFVGSPMTEGYVNNMEWQESAILNDNRGLRGVRTLIGLTV